MRNNAQRIACTLLCGICCAGCRVIGLVVMVCAGGRGAGTLRLPRLLCQPDAAWKGVSKCWRLW